MAITYDVCVARNESGGYQKTVQQDALRLSYQVDFDVEVSDPADENFDPATIGPFDVMAAPQLPRVNGTVYSTPSGQIIPYLVCRDKQATRDARRASRWLVRTRWDSATQGTNQTEADNQPIDPPVAITDIAPREEVRLGIIEEEIFEDYSTPKIPCHLPSGNPYPSPFMERKPTLVLVITQYEENITYEQMLERRFKANENTYRTQPRFTWMIQDVQATEVEVQLAGGPTTAALVTYEIEYTDRTDGWRDRRDLVDTHWIELETKIPIPFEAGELLSFKTGFVQTDGSKKADQTGLPDTIPYETQQTIDFSSFLQV